MPKPTVEELELALKMAAQMRDKNADSFFIAKVLLSHNYRIKYLEEILHHWTLPLNFMEYKRGIS